LDFVEADKIYPKLSIVILNWNSLEDTTECLKSLNKGTNYNYE
jgi:GT2 family glycosyltransferase